MKLTPLSTNTQLDIEYADGGIKAGFPSPAQDYVKNTIDLNKELIRHPSSTFYARCSGDSMKDSGISDGDLLIIDKGLEPKDGNIVVAFIDGDFTLKRIKVDKLNNCVWLMPENEAYQPIKVTEESSFIVWGVVTHNIKSQL